jgi:hypothetical protein
VTALVTIAEDERVRLPTRLIGLPATPRGPQPQIGMEVQVRFAPLRFPGVDGEVLAPFFGPVTPAYGAT